MKFGSLAFITIAASLSMTPAIASEKPPENSMPLSDIVKSLEAKGYSPITEIAMDDGVWEVEAYKDGQERELKVNPANAEIVSDRPDD